MSKESFKENEWRVHIAYGYAGVSFGDGSSVIIGRDYNENISKSNLIAAAPEMYRFIELMLEEDVLYCGNDTAALEILAKARGEK